RGAGRAPRLGTGRHEALHAASAGARAPGSPFRGTQAEGRLMVLIDTSVWIRAVSGLEPWETTVYGHPTDASALGPALVYGELLMGDRGQRAKTLARYHFMRRAQTVPHRAVVELVRERQLAGGGLSWIDVHLLASARIEKVALWTVDRPLAVAAEKLDC